MLNEQVQAFIESKVGAIEEATLLDEQGCTSQVRKIITKSGTYILKSSTKEQYREWLKTEAQVLKDQVNNPHIKLPIFFGFFETKEDSHLLMSFEQGISLTRALKLAPSKSEKQALVSNFGRFLHKLHTLPAPPTTGDWLAEQLEKATLYLEQGEVDGTAALLQQLKANKPNQVEQTWIHGDCTPDNVLVFNGEVTLFIDVAAMTVGDPRCDVALALRRFSTDEELKTAFHRGYSHLHLSEDEFQYFNDGLYEFF